MNFNKLKTLIKFTSYGKNLKSIKRLDKRGLLYHMDYTADYYKLLPTMQKMIKTGCSTFIHKNLEGEPIMGRNFDLRHYWKDPKTSKTIITGLAVVVNAANKKAKYKSIGIADAVYMDPTHPTYYEGCLDDGKTDITRALALPFLCMDGINEKGLAVAVMHLSTENRWDEIEYKDYKQLTDDEKERMLVLNKPGEVPDPNNARTRTGALAMNTVDKKAWKVYKNFGCHQTRQGKESVVHTVLMRMMLDNCATVDEAIKLADSYNMISTPDADNHILVGDASGKSVMLEWINNELVITEVDHGTNFYSGKADHYGYGFERDDVMTNAKNTHPNGMSEEFAMETMKKASQNFEEDRDYGYTQWSAVYNMIKGTVDVCVHMDYEQVYKFSINK